MYIQTNAFYIYFLILNYINNNRHADHMNDDEKTLSQLFLGIFLVIRIQHL